MIISECRIDHASAVVDHHFLVQRGAERLRDATFDLAATLHRIDDAARVCRVHAAEDFDHAAALADGNTERLDVEGDRARRSRRLSGGKQPASLGPRRLEQSREADALSHTRHLAGEDVPICGYAASVLGGKT